MKPLYLFKLDPSDGDQDLRKFFNSLFSDGFIYDIVDYKTVVVNDLVYFEPSVDKKLYVVKLT